MFLSLLAALGIFSGVSAHAENRIDVQQRLHSSYCTYASSRNVDAIVRYVDNAVPWGTRVFLVYGWEHRSFFGDANTSPWQESREVELTPTAPFTWQGKVSETIAYRSGQRNFIAMNLVVKVVQPNGQVFFEKGSNTQFGYYQMPFLFPYSRCVNNTSEIEQLPYLPGQLLPVQKN